MTHTLIEKSGSETLFVLFHGTGGNEYSLLFLTGELDPRADVIGFSGSYGSGKERRFFMPLLDNQLDTDDFKTRITDFLAEWDQLSLTYPRITFIGYSNGANFIQGIIAKRPEIADTIILLHPHQLSLSFTESASQPHLLLTTGANDTLSLAGETLKLEKQLQNQFSADVKLIITDGHHEVNDDEVTSIKNWYHQLPHA